MEIIVVETDMEGAPALHPHVSLHLSPLQTRPQCGATEDHGAAHKVVQGTVHG